MSSQPLFARLRHMLVQWLAVLIALFAAVAPTLSHAIELTPGRSSVMHVICASTGVQSQATPDSTDSADGQESAPVLEHCPFCLLLHDRAAPPPQPKTRLFSVQDGPTAPTVGQAFFFPNYFALTPPRGPPEWT